MTANVACSGSSKVGAFWIHKPVTLRKTTKEVNARNGAGTPENINRAIKGIAQCNVTLSILATSGSKRELGRKLC